MALLSILELYNDYSELFNDLVIPTAADITDDADKVSSPFVPDKNDLIAYICMQYAELEVVYADPVIMKQMIKIWSEVHNPTWCALYNTLLYAYNPIWNKDGLYTETRNLKGTNYRTANLSESGSFSETDGYTVTSMATTHTGSVTHNVTGFDTNSLQPESSDVPNTTDSTSGSTSNTKGGTNSHGTSGTDKYDTTDTGSITRREVGNIGVTTTQRMIEEQRELVRFNLYETIAEDFKEQFLVMIY